MVLGILQRVLDLLLLDFMSVMILLYRIFFLVLLGGEECIYNSSKSRD